MSETGMTTISSFMSILAELGFLAGFETSGVAMFGLLSSGMQLSEGRQYLR
jgi:hypothetical protein